MKKGSKDLKQFKIQCYINNISKSCGIILNTLWQHLLEAACMKGYLYLVYNSPVT